MGAQIAFPDPALHRASVARSMPGAGAWPWATLLAVGADVAAISIARALALALWRWIHPAGGIPGSVGYWESLSLFTLAYAALGLYAGLPPGVLEELRRAVAGTAFACLVLMASLFFFGNAGSYSRGLLVLSGCFTALAVPLGRSLARRLFSSRSWWGVPVIVLGAGHTAQVLIERLRGHPEMGLRPVACLDDDGETEGECAGVPVAGPLSLARALAKSLRVRHAVVAMPRVARQDLFWLLDDWAVVFRRVILIPDLFDSRPVSARDLSGVLGLDLRQNLSIPLNRWVKRVLDIAGAGVLGILALPLLAAAALWIKLAGGGSVLYRQERGGECGRSLWISKLRTMHRDAEALLPHVLSASPEVRAEWMRRFKLKQDPRILPGVGRFLRRTSLDELPQLWSVLKGEMSLVGPRPFPRYHLDGFGPRFRALRDSVKPGLTGLWQVSDRADGDLAVQEALDTYYIRNWSLWLDLYILARTVRAVLFPKGAY